MHRRWIGGHPAVQKNCSKPVMIADDGAEEKRCPHSSRFQDNPSVVSER
jgi:hypothetical protein